MRLYYKLKVESLKLKVAFYSFKKEDFWLSQNSLVKGIFDQVLIKFSKTLYFKPLTLNFLLCTLYLIPFTTHAQVDSLSYQYFLQQDLGALKKVTNEALKQNIDFFYLRTRIGITAFNKKNYDLAYKHLKVAHELFPEDTVVQEYVFYSLKNNFRTTDAETFAKTLSSTMQAKLMKTKEPFITPVISVGTMLSPQIKNAKNEKGSANIYAQGTNNGTMTFEDIALKFRLNHKNSLSVGFSNFNTNAQGFVQTTFKDSALNYKNQQIQTNIYYNRYLKKGVSVGIGGGYYHIKSNSFSSSFDFFKGYYFTSNSVTNNAHSILLNTNKRGAYYSFGLQTSLFTMNNNTQKQVSGNFNLYPLGNTKLIVGGGLHGTFATTNQFIYNASASFTPKSWLQLSAQYWKGNLQNFVGDAGFVVYNTADPIQQIITLKSDFFFKRFTISPSISLQKRESGVLQYTSFTTYQTQNSIYNTQLINLSFLWKF